MKNFLTKLLKWLLVSVIIVVLVLIVFVMVSVFARKKMIPVETGLLTEDVYSVKDRYVNVYIVRDGNEFVAIDAGISSENVREQLKKLDINPDRVRAVFLTHTDSDHAGGLSLFRNATVCMHEDEEQMINGEAGRILWIGNKIDAADYILLDDKIVMTGNIRITPVPAPGHTSGLTCYRVNEKYLFTGDAVSLNKGAIGLFPKYINKNARMAVKSVENITALEGVQYIFTGHHGYSADYNGAVRGYTKQPHPRLP